jgi:hypothetical protein
VFFQLVPQDLNSYVWCGGYRLTLGEMWYNTGSLTLYVLGTERESMLLGQKESKLPQEELEYVGNLGSNKWTGFKAGIVNTR